MRQSRIFYSFQSAVDVCAIGAQHNCILEKPPRQQRAGPPRTAHHCVMHWGGIKKRPIGRFFYLSSGITETVFRSFKPRLNLTIPAIFANIV